METNFLYFGLVRKKLSRWNGNFSYRHAIVQVAGKFRSSANEKTKKKNPFHKVNENNFLSFNSPLIFCRAISLPGGVGSCQLSMLDYSCQETCSKERNEIQQVQDDLKLPCISLIDRVNYQQRNCGAGGMRWMK